MTRWCSGFLPFAALCLGANDAGLAEDFGVHFLYMDMGFFPVPKKAAPTKILGLGLRLLKLIVMAFFISAGLLLLREGVALVETLLNQTCREFKIRKHKSFIN